MMLGASIKENMTFYFFQNTKKQKEYKKKKQTNKATWFPKTLRSKAATLCFNFLEKKTKTNLSHWMA